MKTIFQRVKSALRAFRQSPASTRGYAGAAHNRLTADWSPSTSTGDSEIRYDIESLRSRARDLEIRDPLTKRGLCVLEENVLKIGCGYSFQNLATNPDRTPDFLANQKIADAWLEWTKPENCTLNGEDSFAEVLRLALRSCARDGGILIDKVIGPDVNEFGFALRMLEIDHLDINHNSVTTRQGNKITMGIEKDAMGKTVAYHILRNHPGDLIFGASPRDRIRIPASELVHYFVKERVSQCVGVPWFAPSMMRLHHLAHYEESEIIASREGANKGVFFKPTGPTDYQGDDEVGIGADGQTEKTGAKLSQSEPGTSEILPVGWEAIPYDPTHPTQQYGDFTTHAKLGISAGFNMSYATLVGDLTKVSFSSIRAGSVAERQAFMKIQAHQIVHLVEPIFRAWLEMAILIGKVNLPMSKFAQFHKPYFRGKRWDWVDPEKDLQAKKLELELGLRPRASIIDEGTSELDLEETFTQLAYEEKLAKEKKLSFAMKAEAEIAGMKPAPVHKNGNGNGKPKEENEEEPASRR